MDASEPNPFPGLRPFEYDENHLFFGRDGQNSQLMSKLAQNHFVAVVGTSSSGKSSLVRAGLLPALQGGMMASAGSNWRIAILRPGGDPLGNLALALSAPDVLGDAHRDDSEIQRALAEATLRRSEIGLVELVRQARLPSHENLLIVVDQFEELFRYTALREGGGDEAAPFVSRLLAAARQRELPIYVVLTLRSDFLGDCERFAELPAALNAGGLYLVPRMTRQQCREAVVGPIAVGGGRISPPLLSRLLNDIGDNPDQLPILQHALMRTWESWSTHRLCDEAIGLPHYEIIGTMSSALSLHADEAFNDLPDERSRRIAETLFKALTERGDDNREIRRPTSLAELCSVAEATPDEVSAVIEVFRRPRRSFLMPPAGVTLTPETIIDISHESLVRNWERLRRWVDEEAHSARTYRRLAETADLHKSGSASLLSDLETQLALEWRSQQRPNHAWARRYHQNVDGAMRFLDMSASAREARMIEVERHRSRRLRTIRHAAAAMSLLALVTLSLTIYSYGLRIRAEEQRRIAKEQQRMAEAERARALTLTEEMEKQKNFFEQRMKELEQAGTGAAKSKAVSGAARR